jgi:hypothetical protein
LYKKDGRLLSEKNGTDFNGADNLTYSAIMVALEQSDKPHARFSLSNPYDEMEMDAAGRAGRKKHKYGSGTKSTGVWEHSCAYKEHHKHGSHWCRM